MFKEIANLASLVRQAQQMSGKLQSVNDQLKQQRARGSAGGGMVEVEVNGLGEMLRLQLDPMLVERGDREMIEELVPAAVNLATAKAKQLHLAAMQEMTKELQLPGLQDALAQLTSGSGQEG